MGPSPYPNPRRRGVAGLTAGLDGLLSGSTGGGGPPGSWRSRLPGTGADSLVGARLPGVGNEATNVVCTLVARAWRSPLFVFFIHSRPVLY